MKEAILYEPGENLNVSCHLCPHDCVIKTGGTGVCGVRKNAGGTLFSMNYGKVVAIHNDPVEKKPLFHFLPGSRTLSFAAAGCNLRCMHCQNWSISQWPRDKKGWVELPGDDVPAVNIAEAAAEAGSASISYTYTEPTIYIEYALDVMKEAKKRGLKNIFVTNGYMSGGCVQMISPLLDAANVDLKSSSDEFYKNICGGRVGPVMETIKLLWKAGVWVEVTTLLIPGRNDSNEDIQTVADFLAGISKDIPWHVSMFHPDYKLTDAPRTPAETLIKAMKIGKKAGLKFVYAGNILMEGCEDTRCPKCGKTVVERSGFSVVKNELSGGRCPQCKNEIPGRWQ